MDLLEKVFLLGILKKQSDETTQDVIHQLVNNGSMSMKEAKKILKSLQEDSLVDSDGNLTFTGVTHAQQAENEFKI